MKTLLRNQRVRRLPAVIALCASLALPLPALAWDGFDADSADLVEIIPDALPNKGDTVDVRNYSNDETTPAWWSPSPATAAPWRSWSARPTAKRTPW